MAMESINIRRGDPIGTRCLIPRIHRSQVSGLPAACFLLQSYLLVDNDAAASDDRCGVGGIRCYLVVIDDVSSGNVPYLDSELILTAAAIDLTIDNGEQEAEF
jgi:hypothetical protein